MNENEQPYSTCADEPKLSDRVKVSVWDLANTVNTQNGTKNGRTALYWHLIMVLQQHAKRTYDES